MKLALVHDYFNEAGGAERVLRVLSEMYPEAPIYTSFIKNGTAKKMFEDRKLIESKWGWFLKMGRFYSYFRFLLPWIWKSLDLSAYDLIITSSSGYIARGFQVRKDANVVAYCHTPPKWLYGYETPTEGRRHWWGKAYLTIFGPFVRYFDYVSAQRVDHWLANSREVVKRIEKFYRKNAEVIYPPVEIGESFGRAQGKSVNRRIGDNKKKDYYLLVTRVTGAKGVLEAARAAQAGKFRLKIVGETIVKKIDAELSQMDGWVEREGRVSQERLVEMYVQARGFIALARDEDFGMTVVEAMLSGTPVLALNSGGYKETVKPGISGILIDDTDTKSVSEGMKLMESTKWDRVKIKKWAETFNRETFETKVRKIVNV